MTITDPTAAQNDSTSDNLPVAVTAHPASGRAAAGRWRHSAPFIAQLAGQMSERRQDRLYHWRRPQAAREAYTACHNRKPARLVHTVV